mgnify:CR=1 FL=1
MSQAKRKLNFSRGKLNLIRKCPEGQEVRQIEKEQRKQINKKEIKKW